MSFDDQEFDLLAAFQQRFGISQQKKDDRPPDTRVLSSAEFIASNSVDVFIDRTGTERAADHLCSIISDPKLSPFTTAKWSQHELHPSVAEYGENGTIDFIFTMDLLNFCFWSDAQLEEDEFCVEYRGKRWKGYRSLVAALRRALEEDVPFTNPDFWQCEEECNEDLLKKVFRSETVGQMPLLRERLLCLKEAGTILYERFDCSFSNCIKDADKSAARLVNILADSFPCLRDECCWEDTKVRFLKRAQIMVADLWACFDGKGPGEFDDIDTAITAFADYRIPQMLHSLGCIYYSPPLDNRIRQRLPIEVRGDWEIQIRGCSVWTIELLRRSIHSKLSLNEPGLECTEVNDYSENGPTQRISTGDVDIDSGRKSVGASLSQQHINAIILDYFLYDSVKARELELKADLPADKFESSKHDMIPHHRTRSIWY